MRYLFIILIATLCVSQVFSKPPDSLKTEDSILEIAVVKELNQLRSQNNLSNFVFSKTLKQWISDSITDYNIRYGVNKYFLINGINDSVNNLLLTELQNSVKKNPIFSEIGDVFIDKHYEMILLLESPAAKISDKWIVNQLLSQINYLDILRLKLLDHYRNPALISCSIKRDKKNQISVAINLVVLGYY